VNVEHAEKNSALRSPRSRRLLLRSRSGYTFVELLVVATIILILASAIMPLAMVRAALIR